jgi:hypothetical protein
MIGLVGAAARAVLRVRRGVMRLILSVFVQCRILP